MVEFEQLHEPDFYQIAAEKLRLSKKEKEVLDDYETALFHALLAYYLIPTNENKKPPIHEFKEYADKESPAGSAVFKRVIEKEEALRHLYHLVFAEYSLDA